MTTNKQAARTISAMKAQLGLPDDADNATVLAAVEVLFSKVRARLGLPKGTDRRAVLATLDARLASPRTGKASTAAVGRPAGVSRQRGRVYAGATIPTGLDPAHYAVNPAVDELSDRFYADAVAVNPNVPTLFESGDLPPFTASGMDPAVLQKLPWHARHAVAAAQTLAEAQRMVDDLSGPDGVLSAQVEGYSRHPGTGDYLARVRQWAMAGGTAAVEREEKAAAARERAVSAAVAPTVNGQTEEQDYERIFGEVDRRAAARQAEREAIAARGGAIRGWHG